MQLDILTPEKKIFSGEASLLMLPGLDGLFEILDRHAPLIAAIGQGTLKYQSDKQTAYLKVSGGFVECLNNKVVVLAEKAELV
jgi:F-type H+-transporting ATPase subunit epsilon